MHRNLALGGLAAILAVAMAAPAGATDVKISGKIALVKAGKLAKLVSKDPTLTTLPTAGSGNDPTLVGAQVEIFDTIPGGGGSFTHLLDKTGWKGLGNPAGSKGYKYTGSKALPPDTLCTSVQVKPGKAKVKCKTVPGLSTPFTGDDGIILGIPAGTAPALRYCADFGGTTKKNDATELKRKDAPAPPMCPVIASTPTVTATATRTNTPANTATRTSTNTPVNTATATNTPANTATRTSTNTPVNTATATNTPVATATSTGTRTNSPTPTNTPIVCPLAAPNRYTLTTTGGALKVASFGAFAFPAGGTTIQDVSAGDANCVHQTVIPYPGGLFVPQFCVPALGATTSVTQSGCGVGEIDSNGGSDFTVSETGDTSTSSICSVLQATCPPVGPAPDSSGRLDVTVGDGTADTCSSGTANAITSIPVQTLTWVAADSSCPDTDMTYNPGTDVELATFPQTLDLTTDTSSAKFAELGTANACTKSGLGPAGPYNNNAICVSAGNPYPCCTGVGTGTCTGLKGACIDLGLQKVSVVGSGTIFSSGGPTYDLLFETINTDNITGPTAFGGATCGSPPSINFAGSATRCIVGP